MTTNNEVRFCANTLCNSGDIVAQGDGEVLCRTCGHQGPPEVVDDFSVEVDKECFDPNWEADDGQPSEMDEWADFMGGDDNFEYDECNGCW